MIALTKISVEFAKDGILGTATCEVWLSPENVTELQQTLVRMQRENKPELKDKNQDEQE